MDRFTRAMATEWKSFTVRHKVMIFDTMQQKFRVLRIVTLRNTARNSQISINTRSFTGGVTLVHWKNLRITGSVTASVILGP